MSKIFNPLNQVEETEIESTSSLINDTLGVCPKCRQPFDSAIANGDTVYYCVKCRVSQPIKQ
jgi:tRNA(Ile2) C34 agmatinyltransferase TiaS